MYLSLDQFIPIVLRIKNVYLIYTCGVLFYKQLKHRKNVEILIATIKIKYSVCLLRIKLLISNKPNNI